MSPLSMRPVLLSIAGCRRSTRQRPRSSEPLVVVGLPPGSRHELGALAFAVAVRRRGVGVLYLGPDVPVASWVHVIEQNRARVAVIVRRPGGGPGSRPRRRRGAARYRQQPGPRRRWQEAPTGTAPRKPVWWCFPTASTRRPASPRGWRSGTDSGELGRGSRDMIRSLHARSRVGLKLTVLGSSAAWSERPGRPSSCYMLEIGDEAILLDLGQGSLGSLFPHRDPSTRHGRGRQPHARRPSRRPHPAAQPALLPLRRAAQASGCTCPPGCASATTSSWARTASSSSWPAEL